MIYRAIWPLLRTLDPETAHRLTIRSLSMGAGALWPHGEDPPSLRCTVLGLSFRNPVGIAAGFDKDGAAAGGLLALGFGFAELGTVTPRAQAGNPRPRLFRLEEDRAIINRMGFNNRGAAALAARLGCHRPAGIIGINIGANKDSADRMSDYVVAFEAVSPYADYITVNISSPNTPGLRGLQNREELRGLVGRLQSTRTNAARALPLLVKIAPDLDSSGLSDIAEIALETGLDGLIISNTTIDEREVLKSPHAQEAGGLSGAPLFKRSTQVLKEMFTLTKGKVPLIGVGGIASPRDAYEKILNGASLVQMYTGLVYEGPGLLGRITKGLARILESDGYMNVSAAIGAATGISPAHSQAPTRSA